MNQTNCIMASHSASDLQEEVRRLLEFFTPQGRALAKRPQPIPSAITHTITHLVSMVCLLPSLQASLPPVVRAKAKANMTRSRFDTGACRRRVDGAAVRFGRSSHVRPLHSWPCQWRRAGPKSSVALAIAWSREMTESCCIFPPSNAFSMCQRALSNAGWSFLRCFQSLASICTSQISTTPDGPQKLTTGA